VSHRESRGGAGVREGATFERFTVIVVSSSYEDIVVAILVEVASGPDRVAKAEIVLVAVCYPNAGWAGADL
jgi:hypothetical protein